MKKAKVIRLLRSLSLSEMDALEQFLSSPYYNQDMEVVRLFEVLKRFYPAFDAPELNKSLLFRQVFPKQPYDDKQLRYLMSDLNKLAEQFLGVQEMERDPYRPMLARLERLSAKGLDKGYRQVVRNLKKELENPKVDSSEYFLTRLQWSELRERHFQRQRLRKFDPSIQQAAENLDRYYFLHRLKLACAMLDRQTIVQADYELNLSAAWIRHLEEQSFFNEPIIQVYYAIFQALLNEEEERHFVTLKNFLEEKAFSLASRDLKDIYLFAINYCARKIRQGRERYVTEALSLYRSGIESEVLIDEGVLSPWTFTNVVKLSLRLQHYEWIEGFIRDYAPKLPEDFRDNALHYNLAELYYYTDRFEEAQEHLNQVVFSDLNYYLGARVMLAKIYFETDQEEPLLSLVSSFTIFLKRNKKVSTELKHTYLNFCRLLFQIVRRSPSRMKQLKEEIRSTELLTDRKWLLRMYERVTAD